MRAGGGRLVELAGGEGALQGVVLVLDLLQLEVLPLRTEVIGQDGAWNKFTKRDLRKAAGDILTVLKPVQLSRERAVLDRCELELSHEFHISALVD